MKKIAFTTGGTGGHIYPALSLANEMKKRGYEVIFIGTCHRMEKEIVPKAGYKFYGLDILPFNSIKSVLKGIKAVFEIKKILKQENVDTLIGFGNYISIPSITAAKLLKINIYLQEQNIVMGKANKYGMFFAKKVFLAFGNSLDLIKRFKSKCVVTGNPLRYEFYNITKEDARNILSIPNENRVILVMGGSLGAKSINEAILSNIDKINEKEHFTLYWSTGEKLYKEVQVRIKNFNNIIVMPYFENVYEIMAASDLVICRSGASTISELLQLEKPSILIPYDYVGQKENAEMLEYVDAAKAYTNESAKSAILEALSLCEQDSMLNFMRENIKTLNTGNAVNNILKEMEDDNK